MGAYNRKLTIGLAAASANDIALSQSTAGAANLLINGANASGGVATMTYASQVLFTFNGNESGHNFTVTGTNANGQAQTEVVAGGSGTAVTVYNYLTVTQIAVSAATTSTLTVGTNAIGSSQVMIIDRFINPAIISVACVVTGTINFSVQVSYDDFGAVGYDLVTTPPTWFSPTALASQTGNVATTLQGPTCMLRVLQNSGTGLVAVTVNLPMGNVG